MAEPEPEPIIVPSEDALYLFLESYMLNVFRKITKKDKDGKILDFEQLTDEFIALTIKFLEYKVTKSMYAKSPFDALEMMGQMMGQAPPKIPK